LFTDVNKLAVAVFIFVIDVFTLALFVFNALILICCEADEAFNCDIDESVDAVYELNEEVVTKLPVLIVLPLTSGMFTANVEASPFVNVKFLVPVLNDAVTNELAVIADVTYDDVAAFKALILICCEADEAFNCVIELFTLPLLVFNALILICCEADDAFN
jgi:hypothetical protein